MSLTNPPRYNVWQKILKCTKCHAALNYYTKGPKQPPYLRCYEAGKGKCDAKAIRVDRSEGAFRELLTKVNSLSLVQSDARSIQAQMNEVGGRIAVLQRDMDANLKFLRTRPSPAIRALVADADDEVRLLQQKQAELEQSLATDRITNKEDFFARLDLESYEGRARANELMKRLGILVTASKAEDTIKYVAYKKELKILEMTDTGDGTPIQSKSYSGEVSTAMYVQGDTDELFADGGFRKLRKPGNPTKPVKAESTGPDWTQYDEPLAEHDYEDEYTVPESGSPS